MPREGLKDKLDGDELDLSLNNLTSIPVKEIAALPKAKRLDLSCNAITTIPREFSLSLTNIVKIDLSKNQLRELPENIGLLVKLQHLDLFANQLTSLPISMCDLKNLKWLDLKDNPLVEPLHSIAGDCLDEVQCRKCAQSITLFMRNARSEEERQRQRRLQEQRDLEAKRKAEEEAENKRKKVLKKLEKEKRRKEYEAEREKERQRLKAEQQAETDSSDDASTEPSLLQEAKQAKAGLGWCGVLLAVLCGLAAVLSGLLFFCRDSPDRFCRDAQWLVTTNYQTASHMATEYYNLVREKTNELVESISKK